MISAVKTHETILAVTYRKRALFRDYRGSTCRATDTILLSFSGPAGQFVRCEMRGGYSGSWTVRWTPDELGVYVIDVEYGQSPVVGSPFACKVFDLSKVVMSEDQQFDQLDDSGDVVFYGASRHIFIVIVIVVSSSSSSSSSF